MSIPDDSSKGHSTNPAASQEGMSKGLTNYGDRIRLSVANRELTLLVSDEELKRRAEANPVQEPAAERGYRKLFLTSVTQADRGVDFDFLMPPLTAGTLPRID